VAKGNRFDEIERMPFDELIALLDQVEILIGERLAPEKKSLISKLEAIHRFEAKRNSKRSGLIDLAEGESGIRRRLRPKYENPATGQTWAGRGKQPLWLREAIQHGRTQEEFLMRDDAPANGTILHAPILK
jgi:DNA-binding protein H-NS